MQDVLKVNGSWRRKEIFNNPRVLSTFSTTLLHMSEHSLDCLTNCRWRSARTERASEQNLARGC